MDRLSPLLSHFSFAARVFHSGTMCQSTTLDTSEAVGYLHVLRGGRLVVRSAGQQELRLEQPTVLFYPRPSRHRFVVDRGRGADLVCATLDYGLDVSNPLIRGLPDRVVIPLNGSHELAPAVSLLFAEAFERRAGKEAALDRLFEYLLLLILRHAMDAQLMDSGVRAGLAHPKLSKAMAAVHQDPQEEWTLERLGRKAGMSRSRFAFHFHRCVGMTPLDYLTEWRLSLAQVLLKEGRPVKTVAPEVGYSSAAAFNRAFRQRIGESPRRWRVQVEGR